MIFDEYESLEDSGPYLQNLLNNLPPYSIFKLESSRIYKIIDGLILSVEGITLDFAGARIYYPKTSQPWLHCIMATNKNITILNANIFSDPRFVRNDTGFAICINKADNCIVNTAELKDIACAGIWVVKSNKVRITGVTVISPKADGIHISDSCRNFIVSDNIIENADDDSLAAVSDVAADGVFPSDGIFSNNIVNRPKVGHGVVLIGCRRVSVLGNVFTDCAGAAIGSYFWSVTGTPTREDWVEDSLISNNVIKYTQATASPRNAAAACAIYCGAFMNTIISNNLITGYPLNPLYDSSAFKVDNAVNLTIKNNQLKDCPQYGILTSAAVNSEESFYKNLYIIDNIFENIYLHGILIQPSSTSIGRVIVDGNGFIDCGYGPTGSVVNIGKTKNNVLKVTNNSNHTNNKAFTIDKSTALNVVEFNNTKL